VVRTSRNIPHMSEVPIQTHVNSRAWAVLEEAQQHCDKVLADVRAICDGLPESRGLKLDDICCVVVGSVVGQATS
jgi:hypothetical protein